MLPQRQGSEEKKKKTLENHRNTRLLQHLQRGVRVVEGARLESVYTPKGYRGFESLPLCQKSRFIPGFFILSPVAHNHPAD